MDNFKKAQGDTDEPQFLKAMSVIDKLSPINFCDKCCGEFLMRLTKFFFCKSNCKNVVFQEKRAIHGPCRGIKQNKEGFLKISTKLYGLCIFSKARTH